MTLLAPASEAELADMVSDAADRDAPLEIAGGGTRRALGGPVRADATLSTRGVGDIVLYEPGALTLAVGAGAPLAEIERTLAAEGQMLPFEPMDHRALLGSEGEPTIGGVAACAVSGPRRLKAGACRDAMIGARLVDGRGNIVKNGGRVMKNVTGYDLVKLTAGSYGTLGVLTEIAFKLLPAPERVLTLISRGLDMGRAVEAFAEALGSPCEPSGAAWLPDADGSPGRAVLRIEGLAGSAAYRAERLRTLLAGFGDWEILTDSAQNAALWKQVRDVEPLAGGDGRVAGPVWRLSVKPSDGPRIVEEASRSAPLDCMLDWAGGLVWLAAPDETGIADIHAGLRRATAERGGHATLIRASAEHRAALGAFQPEPAPLARISAGLRAKFDPRGILNPGRMQ